MIYLKIKQQKQIKTFLTEEYGNEKGSALFDRQAEILDELIKNTRGKSENQMKTLTKTILPRVAAEKHSSTAKMEAIPGYYFLYSRIFLKIVRTTDLWKSAQCHDKNSFDVTMKKCLWHTACVENGCPELCPLFCDVDNVTYGGLKKLGFSRTQTLGYGGDCCDFHFFRK